MDEGYKGYYTSCPVHDVNLSDGKPYFIDWRDKGKEDVGHYFQCCGLICLKSTRQQFQSIKDWRDNVRDKKPRITSLWVKEALDGDTDIWRDRGELDASYGFGVDMVGLRPSYQVHEAITYLHMLDENIGETVLTQFFLAEPYALAWEMDDLMGAPEMRDDIRRHFNVDLFQLIYEEAEELAYTKNALNWLERNALLSPDPLRATQAMYRLKAKTNQLPKSIHMADINSLLEHSNEAGFEVYEKDISAWFEELKSYGVELDPSNIHPDYKP